MGRQNRKGAGEGYIPPELLTPACVKVDEPSPGVRRLTMDRAKKRNALSHRLRGQLLHHLLVADQDPDIRAVIIRGDGPDFCAGYEVDPREALPEPAAAAPQDGDFVRANISMYFQIWDMGIVVIAQVHGHCLAGGTEL